MGECHTLDGEQHGNHLVWHMQESFRAEDSFFKSISCQFVLGDCFIPWSMDGVLVSLQVDEPCWSHKCNQQRDRNIEYHQEDG